MHVLTYWITYIISPPQYDWNIVESGVKHPKPIKKIPVKK